MYKYFNNYVCKDVITTINIHRARPQLQQAPITTRNFKGALGGTGPCSKISCEKSL